MISLEVSQIQIFPARNRVIDTCDTCGSIARSWRCPSIEYRSIDRSWWGQSIEYRVSIAKVRYPRQGLSRARPVGSSSPKRALCRPAGRQLVGRTCMEVGATSGAPRVMSCGGRCTFVRRLDSLSETGSLETRVEGHNSVKVSVALFSTQFIKCVCKQTLTYFSSQTALRHSRAFLPIRQHHSCD